MGRAPSCRCGKQQDRSSFHIFPQDDNSCSQSLPLDHDLLRMFYPMFVMSWTVVMSLQRMERHQDMRQRGQLLEYDSYMQGLIVFISHEWLGYRHPDPCGVQLRTLHRVLERMVSGQVSVESSRIDQIVGQRKEIVPGAHWKAVLPQCFFWLDYAGVPQLGDDIAVETKMADHRSVGFSDMTLAVRSVPAYLDASSLMLVLTPHAAHFDQPDRICDYGSWLGRGWCRVEMFCAMLARTRVRMLKIVGAEAPITMEYSTDIANRPPGTGVFTCCRRGHMIDGKPLRCDRGDLRMVMEALVEISAKHAKSVGDMDRMRYMMCRAQYWLEGLPADESIDHTLVTDLGAWRQRLSLGTIEQDYNRPVSRCTGAKPGWTILHWAALAGHAAVVREILLEDEGLALLEARATALPAFGVLESHTPLFCAVQASSGTFDAAAVLLQARADATARARMMPLFSASSIFGSVEQMEAWLALFPGDVDVKDSGFGTTPLSATVFLHGACTDKWHVLQAHGADPRASSPIMGPDSPLHMAVLCPSPDLTVVRELLEARCSPNASIAPTTWLMRAPLSAAVMAANFIERRGGKLPMLLDYAASMLGATPLHRVAETGNVDVIRLLLEARGVCQRNARGHTPLQCAERAFGGAPPDAIRLLLADPSGASEPPPLTKEAPTWEEHVEMLDA